MLFAPNPLTFRICNVCQCYLFDCSLGPRPDIVAWKSNINYDNCLLVFTKYQNNHMHVYLAALSFDHHWHYHIRFLLCWKWNSEHRNCRSNSTNKRTDHKQWRKLLDLYDELRYIRSGHYFALFWQTHVSRTLYKRMA